MNQYVEENGLKTVNDEGALRSVVEQVDRRQSAVGSRLSGRKDKSHRILSRTDDEGDERKSRSGNGK